MWRFLLFLINAMPQPQHCFRFLAFPKKALWNRSIFSCVLFDELPLLHLVWFLIPFCRLEIFASGGRSRPVFGTDVRWRPLPVSNSSAKAAACFISCADLSTIWTNPSMSFVSPRKSQFPNTPHKCGELTQSCQQQVWYIYACGNFGKLVLVESVEQLPVWVGWVSSMGNSVLASRKCIVLPYGILLPYIINIK